MNKNVFIGAILAVAGSLLAADASSKDTVSNAVKKLADLGNYTWTSSAQMNGGGGGGGGGGGNGGGGGRGGRGGFGPGTTEGKTEKDGYTVLSMTRGQNTTRAVLKGNKGALRTQEGWQPLSEAAEDQSGGGGGGGGGGRGRFTARMLQNYKLPAVEAQELLGKVKDLKEADGAYTGDLTEEGARSLLRMGGRGGGGGGPEISGAKGSVKFWVNDGTLTKFQTHVQGSMSFNGNDREIDRTTTVEIKDAGATKVEVPSEAAKKIS